MSTTQEFSDSVQSFINAILAAIPDPSDAVQVFTALREYPAAPMFSGSNIGEDQAILYDSISNLCRRQTVGALAQAASFYQPSSYDNAANLRTAICAVIDAEITIAGDNGEDGSYQALISLRAAVVQDLTARGATLAPLANIEVKNNLPALTLAYRLYQDIGRSDQLVSFANPPHPAFMPTQFRALSR